MRIAGSDANCDGDSDACIPAGCLFLRSFIQTDKAAHTLEIVFAHHLAWARMLACYARLSFLAAFCRRASLAADFLFLSADRSCLQHTLQSAQRGGTFNLTREHRLKAEGEYQVSSGMNLMGQCAGARRRTCFFRSALYAPFCSSHASHAVHRPFRSCLC